MIGRAWRAALAGAALVATAFAGSAPPAVLAQSRGEDPGSARFREMPPHERLLRLAFLYWQGYLFAHPTAATAIGDPRYDDRLEDETEPALARERQRLGAVLERANRFEEASLDHADRITLLALRRECEDAIARMDCHFDEWMVDPLDGPQVAWMNPANQPVVVTPDDGVKYCRRVHAMAEFLDTRSANLARGLASGRVASREAVEKTIAEIRALLAQPDAKFALFAPIASRHEGWTDADEARFAAELRLAVNSSARPAFLRYADFLATRILPSARPPERAGLGAIPGGDEMYRSLIRVETSLPRTPRELHELGLQEVARARASLVALGQSELGTTDFADLQRRLRSDPELHFESADEIEETSRRALYRAIAEIPRWFGALPRTPCEVRVMGEAEAEHSTISYYRNGTADGRRPGSYMVNTSRPAERARYEAEVLVFHEAIPGHHLQVALAQEMEGLPEFRRHEGVTAFSEGWALYAEQLADTMGLYSGDLDRLGMRAYDAWRASRLVVDTGLNAMGWSRDRAVEYLRENTVLGEESIADEVERYLAWPGQALAYKVGELEILDLRDKARHELGPRFDIRAFHDAVLRNGAVSLPVLREEIEAWIAAAKG